MTSDAERLESCKGTERRQRANARAKMEIAGQRRRTKAHSWQGAKSLFKTQCMPFGFNGMTL